MIRFLVCHFLFEVSQQITFENSNSPITIHGRLESCVRMQGQTSILYHYFCLHRSYKVCGCEFNMQKPPLCYKSCHIIYTHSHCTTMANIVFLFHSTNCCFLPLNSISDLQSMKSFWCFLSFHMWCVSFILVKRFNALLLESLSCL